MYTHYQIAELTKCVESFDYFCSHFIKIPYTPSEYRMLNLYPEQRELAIDFDRHKLSRVLYTKRQLGITTTTLAYIIYHSLFSPDQQSIIVSNNINKSKDMLCIINNMISMLPLWILSDKLITNTKTEITFENNSVIKCVSKNENNFKGRSANLIYMDNINDMTTQCQNELYNVIMPLAFQLDTQVIISAFTPNLNMQSKMFESTLFYDIIITGLYGKSI
jgi:hypothetical protein